MRGKQIPQTIPRAYNGSGVRLRYDVKKTRYLQSGRIKAGWEIDGVDRKTIEKFSRRTEQVEQAAKDAGISNAAEKSKLGVKTREQKDKGTPIDQLQREWRSRLSDDERGDFSRLGQNEMKLQRDNEMDAVKLSVKFAIDHQLHSQSTVERHAVVGTALEHGLTLTPELVESTIESMDVIRRSRSVDGAKRDYVTTREVLAAEREIISYVRDGRGTRKAMGKSEHSFARDWLHDEQKAAVSHVLESRDAVMAVTGGAGTGKSSLMQEAGEALRGNGKEVFAFAPSTGARDVLQEKGFNTAQTVEHLLRNTDLQSQVRDQVIWIDEAGLLDVRSMRGIFSIAKEQNARVVLSGDTRQHSSPSRGEAMRMLEKEARISTARVETIQRQKGEYRSAIEMISRGNEPVDEFTNKTGLLAGFDELDRMGKIKEIGDDDRHALLADQYVELIGKKRSTLIVAPTHAEARTVTSQIRDRLKATGTLHENDHSIAQLRSMNLSDAEKTQAATYQSGSELIIQFHQNVSGGFKRGDRYRVADGNENDVKLTPVNGGQTKVLPLDAAERFEVYRETEVSMAVGDQVRFTLGGTGIDGKRRVSNGRMDEIAAFDMNGDMRLKSGFTIRRDYGHLDLGYVVTSHASQGKDRQVAIAAMGSESLPAMNAKQFYVTASRGSEDLTIYVDDKAKVRRAIARSGEQLSATELVGGVGESSKNAERPQQHDHAYFRQAHEAYCAFRDRVTAWWRDNRETQPQRAPVANQQTPGFHNALGMGLTPDLSRSR